MDNKIILITGSTDGIGKFTATTLAKQGHTVIIHGRNKEKAEYVQKQIVEETGNQKIDILIADLLSLEDVKRAADQLIKNYSHLDVLINNAGAFFNKDREITEEGFEKTITLNLFAPFLLTLRLLKILEKSDSARIINVSSEMHKRSGKPDFNDFQSEKNYKPNKAYGLSKLYLIWISRYLAKKLQNEGKRVTVNVFHPGAVATNFGQASDKGFLINLVFKVAYPFMDKPEKGAKTSVYLATSPEVENVTGKYYGNNKNEEKPNEKYYSLENEKIVWQYCVDTIGKFQ